MDAYSPDIHRRLPMSVEAEMGLLGSLLISPNEVMEFVVQHRIEPMHFHTPANATIFQEIMDMYEAGVLIDFIALTQRLSDKKELDRVGGPAYVTGLFTFVPTAANAEHYTEIIKEKFTLRSIIVGCNEIAARAYEESVEVILPRAESVLLGLIEVNAHNKERTLSEQVDGALDWVDMVHDDERRQKVLLFSGIPELDDLTGGFIFGTSALVKGSVGGGKSSLLQQVGIHALRKNMAVAHFSLELPEEMQVTRYLSTITKVPIAAITQGWCTEEQRAKLNETGPRFKRSKLDISATAMDALQIRSRCRKLKAKFGESFKLAIIDYIQKVVPPIGRDMNNTAQLTYISDQLQKMALELGIVVLIGSQVNNDGDALGSKMIGGDARTIIEIVKDKSCKENGSDSERKLVVSKNNNGPVGECKVIFKRGTLEFAGGLL